jgi:hypothetical protein
LYRRRDKNKEVKRDNVPDKISGTPLPGPCTDPNCQYRHCRNVHKRGVNKISHTPLGGHLLRVSLPGDGDYEGVVS